jgi:hypothetical protein
VETTGHSSFGGDSAAGVPDPGRQRLAAQTLRSIRCQSRVQRDFKCQLTIQGMSQAYCPVLLLLIMFNTIENTSLEIESNSRLLIWALFTIALRKRNSLYRKSRTTESDTYFSSAVFRGNSDGSLMKAGSEFQASCDRRMMFLRSVSTRL